MENRDKIISEFCEQTKEILNGILYGIIEYGNPKGEDLDICVVTHKRDETHVKELIKLKEDLENKYKIKLDALYIPSQVFSEALSRISNELNQTAIEEQIKLRYGDSNFYEFVIFSIINPVDKPPLKIDEYRL